MSATFTQSLRALEADRVRGKVAGIVVAGAFLAAWGLWALRASVTVHETSEAARIEVSQAAHSIDAPVAGRVVSTHIALGADVRAGDLLLEIDAEDQRGRLAEEEARLSSIQPELDALARQIASLQESRGSDREATSAALDQARARYQEAKVAAAEAEEEARREERLAAQGAVSDAERLRARAAADARAAAAESLSREAARLEAAQRARDMDQASRAEELRRVIASLEGARRTASAAAEVLRHEIARRTVRAEVAGRIGADSIVRPGEFVKEGQHLGELVPPGRLRAVADFSPEGALGRVRSGQDARLRLDGFPWAQYGVVPATVAAVGDELHDGKVRVELELRPLAGSPIPLQHGLPGSVEVDVEQVTPADLVLRAVGRRLGRPVDARAGQRP
jgi:membrane fusion protein (multidrug efflux system)